MYINAFAGEICELCEKSYPDHDSVEFWRSIEESADPLTKCHKKVRFQVNLMEILHCEVSNLIRIIDVLIRYRLRKIAGDVSEFGPTIIRKFSKLAMHVD